MSAVPKTGRHHLEALERWDVGAIQCLWALGLGNSWFWGQMAAWVLALCAMLAPSFINMQDLTLVYEYFSRRSSCGMLYDNAESDMVVDAWVRARHESCGGLSTMPIRGGAQRPSPASSDDDGRVLLPAASRRSRRATQSAPLRGAGGAGISGRTRKGRC